MSIYRLFPWLIFAYNLLRFVVPLGVGRWWKLLIAVALLAISQQRTFNRYIIEAMGWQDMPYWLIIVQGLVLSLFLLFTTFVLLRDVSGLGLWAWTRKYPSQLFSSVPLAAWMCATALLLSAIGVWQGVRVPSVHMQEIAIRGLPAGLDGIKIALLADIHVTPLFSKKWVQAVVERANAIKPDLILILGDIVDGNPRMRYEDAAPLGLLKATHGTYGVLGNHDYGSGYAQWMEIFSDMGIRMLKNEHALVAHNDASLALLGINDRAASRRGEAGPDVAAAMAGIPDGAPRILMAHQPYAARENAEFGIDLQVSGHTHGGQIIGLHYVVKGANRGFASRLYRVGDMQLYVSNGTGLWMGLPLRLGRPSEITEIVLRRRQL